MFQFIFGLIRGLWPLWIVLILFLLYKKLVKPVNIRKLDPHDWNNILKTLKNKRKKWSGNLSSKLDNQISNIMIILDDFVPKINNKYSGHIVASDINKFMIQLYELVEEFFDMSKEKQEKDIQMLSNGLNELSNRINKVVETYDNGEENEFIAVVKQIMGDGSIEA